MFGRASKIITNIEKRSSPSYYILCSQGTAKQQVCISLLLIDPYQLRAHISLGTNSGSGRQKSRSMLFGTEHGFNDLVFLVLCFYSYAFMLLKLEFLATSCLYCLRHRFLAALLVSHQSTLILLCTLLLIAFLDSCLLYRLETPQVSHADPRPGSLSPSL